jgi:hypothetical protein
MKGTTINTIKIARIALCAIGALTLSGAARGSRTTGDMKASALASPRGADAPAGAATRQAAHASGHAQLPLHFEINRGQSAPEVTFAARGPGYGLFLTATDAVLVLSSPASARAARSSDPLATPAALASTSPPVSRHTVVRMTFPGANRAPVVSGAGELPGKASYFRGRDPHAWRTNIPTYAKVTYRDLYPGVDLVYYGHDQQLEYDLVVAPEGDPNRIALQFDGVDSLAIAADGDLVLRASGVELRQHKPVIYQEVGDSRQAVDGHYVLRDAYQVGVALGPYDQTKPLVIDPVLAFSSYLGGTRSDIGERLAVDLLGNTYLTGSTTSPDFPTTTGAPLTGDLDDVFVTKVNPEGSALVYSTYLGGTGHDRARDIAIDFAGQAYLTGFTDSADFPIANAVQPTPGGLGDAFVVKVSAGGDALVYSTYLGGSRFDTGAGLALDWRGNAYVTGTTASLNFPTVNAFQPALAGIDPSTDAFVTKVSPAGTALVYSTFLGGGEPESGLAIAVNARGNAYVTGVTGSGDFPTFRPFQPVALRGVSEAFVTKFSQDGSSLVYSSNLGGNRNDAGLDIAVDLFDRAVVVGSTTSTDFPTVRPVQPVPSDTLSTFNGFVTIVNPAGSTLFLSTYVGGTSRDEITGVAVDLAGNVYVVGRTFSSDFRVVNPVQAVLGGGMDAFVAQIDPQRARVVYATYLGGSGDDDGRGIAVDLAGSAYVIGTTTSDDFPVVDALQPVRGGDVDAFFAKITRGRASDTGPR